MKVTIEPMKYHGAAGFHLSYGRDGEWDDTDHTAYEVTVWLPCEYDNGFPPDHPSYQRTVRDYAQVAWGYDWGGMTDPDGDPTWGRAGCERFTDTEATIRRLDELAASFDLDLGDLPALIASRSGE